MTPETKPADMLSPRKGPKPTEQPAAGEQVTYLSGPDGPSKTTWMGHVFHANVPREVTNRILIEAARGNRFFKVGPFDATRDAVTTIEPLPGPKTSDQYRAHFSAWLKTMNSVDELDSKWQGEETLRRECEVGTDDIELMMTLFRPKRSELKKMDMS